MGVVVNTFNAARGIIDTTIVGVPSKPTSYVTLPSGARERVTVTRLGGTGTSRKEGGVQDSFVLAPESTEALPVRVNERTGVKEAFTDLPFGQGRGWVVVKEAAPQRTESKPIPKPTPTSTPVERQPDEVYVDSRGNVLQYLRSGEHQVIGVTGKETASRTEVKTPGGMILGFLENVARQPSKTVYVAPGELIRNEQGKIVGRADVEGAAVESGGVKYVARESKASSLPSARVENIVWRNPQTGETRLAPAGQQPKPGFEKTTEEITGYVMPTKKVGESEVTVSDNAVKFREQFEASSVTAPVYPFVSPEFAPQAARLEALSRGVEARKLELTKAGWSNVSSKVEGGKVSFFGEQTALEGLVFTELGVSKQDYFAPDFTALERKQAMQFLQAQISAGAQPLPFEPNPAFFEYAKKVTPGKSTILLSMPKPTSSRNAFFTQAKPAVISTPSGLPEGNLLLSPEETKARSETKFEQEFATFREQALTGIAGTPQAGVKALSDLTVSIAGVGESSKSLFTETKLPVYEGGNVFEWKTGKDVFGEGVGSVALIAPNVIAGSLGVLTFLPELAIQTGFGLTSAIKYRSPALLAYPVATQVKGMVGGLTQQPIQTVSQLAGASFFGGRIAGLGIEAYGKTKAALTTEALPKGTRASLAYVSRGETIAVGESEFIEVANVMNKEGVTMKGTHALPEHGLIFGLQRAPKSNILISGTVLANIKPEGVTATALLAVSKKGKFMGREFETTPTTVIAKYKVEPHTAEALWSERGEELTYVKHEQPTPVTSNFIMRDIANADLRDYAFLPSATKARLYELRQAARGKLPLVGEAGKAPWGIAPEVGGYIQPFGKEHHITLGEFGRVFITRAREVLGKQPEGSLVKFHTHPLEAQPKPSAADLRLSQIHEPEVSHNIIVGTKGITVLKPSQFKGVVYQAKFSSVKAYIAAIGERRVGISVPSITYSKLLGARTKPEFYYRGEGLSGRAGAVNKPFSMQAGESTKALLARNKKLAGKLEQIPFADKDVRFFDLVSEQGGKRTSARLVQVTGKEVDLTLLSRIARRNRQTEVPTPSGVGAGNVSFLQLQAVKMKAAEALSQPRVSSVEVPVAKLQAAEVAAKGLIAEQVGKQFHEFKGIPATASKQISEMEVEYAHPFSPFGAQAKAMTLTQTIPSRGRADYFTKAMTLTQTIPSRGRADYFTKAMTKTQGMERTSSLSGQYATLSKAMEKSMINTQERTQLQRGLERVMQRGLERSVMRVPAFKVSAISRVSEKTFVNEQQRQQQRVIEREITPVSISKIIPTPRIPIILPARGKGGVEDKLMEVKKKRKAFRVLIKRKGKWRVLETGLPRGLALRAGAGYAVKTLGASFKVEAMGETEKEDVAFQPSSEVFRSFKIAGGKPVPLKDEFIQRRGKRLASSGERAEIQRARKEKSGFSIPFAGRFNLRRRKK